MPKRVVNTPDAGPPGGPYSHAVVAGDTIYLAGACPVLPDGTWVRGDFAEQAHATFRNLRIVAEAAGGSLDQAVRVGVYLRDFADFPAMNEIWKEYFPADALPVRTTLPVALNGFDIEVDAILYTGD
ncbi:RidA family protein [Spirilliplanes yamanashiensis]|uniref:Reactive intermediate/imine deaminase n=1 Tax=Spirilliplanes yamanashiensis TaxID=42233 RepID=A0A8J3YC81_9ACTN|nr:RidA family protein [Spirilliplanes yamanashiensis]MDP9818646.1 reactive intermediate/imine deaminase [Spirilliplanes yamanashiensis]GIJ05102.1 reactive intermediate/imine deaminase [Spirilliplanes yamanashiensis]